ncbi:MAG: hypothetical protein J0L58_10335 [Burkholderiales bacterium]|nr:hypothetical protein [Burkholderiales bacterium]
MTDALEAGRQRCDPATWRALAARLDMQATHLANVKSGAMKMPPTKLEKLAELIEADAGELWELQELEHARRKNPFRRGVAAIGALLGAFTAAVLIAGASGLSRSQADENQQKAGDHALHIVGLMAAHSRCEKPFETEGIQRTNLLTGRPEPSAIGLP